MTVSIEAAKALQGAGFDLPTVSLYVNREHRIATLKDWNNPREKEWTSAPDILTAVMWLWEKYGVWCYISLGYNPQTGFVWFVDDRNSTTPILEGGVPRIPDPLTAYNQAIIAACDYIKPPTP